MALNSTELAVQQANTRMYIEADPITITLNYAALLDTGSGGRRRGPTSTRPPQTVRLVPQGASGNLAERQMLDGQMVQVHYHLVGESDIEIERGDWFFLNGHKHEVVWVTHPGGYETKAEVTDRG